MLWELLTIQNDIRNDFSVFRVTLNVNNRIGAGCDDTQTGQDKDDLKDHKNCSEKTDEAIGRSIGLLDLEGPLSLLIYDNGISFQTFWHDQLGAGDKVRGKGERTREENKVQGLI